MHYRLFRAFRYAAIVGVLFITNVSWVTNPTMPQIPLHEASPAGRATMEPDTSDAAIRSLLAQSIMVAGYSREGVAHLNQLKSWAERGEIGGVIWMQGTVERQIEYIDALNRVTALPLMMAQDAEWGAAMRLKVDRQLPWPLTLGATGSEEWARRYGLALGYESTELGIHMNFSPVVDVNTNPKNPIIGQRALGSDPVMVSKLASAEIKGLQSTGVMACAKHFPGHGDTDSDSHKTLPTVGHDLARLRSVELRPFQAAIDAGVDAIMIAHLNVPALDPTGTPASLSKPIVTHWLRDSLGFEGLIVTDALNMKGVSQDLTPGALEVEAYIAGNDILLFVKDPVAALDALMKAVKQGKIARRDVMARSHKIQAMLQASESQSSRMVVNTEPIKDHILHDAMTLVHDRGRMLGSKGDDDHWFHHAPNHSSPWSKSSVSQEMMRQAAEVRARGGRAGLIFSSNPYGLKPEVMEAFDAVVVTYETISSWLLAQIPTMKPDEFKGRLPVDLGLHLDWDKASPGDVGLNDSVIMNIDAIVQEGLDAGAYPGAHVFLARHGKQVYHGMWGTRDGQSSVEDDDMYDVASLTKILASVPMLMRCYERYGPEFLDYPMERLLPELEGTEVGSAILKEVLAHQSGLPAWIPFYKRFLWDDGAWDQRFLRSVPSEEFHVQVAEGLYANELVEDSIDFWIAQLELGPKQYKYSDLGYYMIQNFLEREFGLDMDDELRNNWYVPLGLEMTYLPMEHGINPHRIAPTEHDQVFRHQVVHGHVHDPGAALLGGVGGHAGIFATAPDVARMMQLYLDGGSAWGRQYLQSETIDAFTGCYACDDGNRRGLGFDRPQEDGPGPTCGCVSPVSFGHTGFTGTFAWADPETGIVLIFLSNRVYPDAENWKISRLDIRTRVQEAVQQAILD